MKTIKGMTLVLIASLSFSVSAFEFKGIKSGMTKEEVSAIAGGEYSLDKEEAEGWLNRTGDSSGISEGVSFEYTHDGKLYGMTIKFSPPNMFLRGKARDGGRDLFYSEICNDGYKVATNRYTDKQYLECNMVDERELARAIKHYRDEYADKVLK